MVAQGSISPRLGPWSLSPQALFLPPGSHRRRGVPQSTAFLPRSFHACLITEEEQPRRKRFLGSKQTRSVADTFRGPMASQAGGGGACSTRGSLHDRLALRRFLKKHEDCDSDAGRTQMLSQSRARCKDTVFSPIWPWLACGPQEGNFQIEAPE